MKTLSRFNPLRDSLNRLALAETAPRIAAALAALALAATPARSQVILVGDFQLYKASSTTTTATITDGWGVAWENASPTNMLVNADGSGLLTYSDSTTGTTADLLQWTKTRGGANILPNGVGGSHALNAFATWGGHTQVETVGSLYTVAAGQTVTISAMVGGGVSGPMGSDLTFGLYANGVPIIPSSAVNVIPGDNAPFQKISRTYSPTALAAHLGASTKIVLGAELTNLIGGAIIYDDVSLVASVPDTTLPTLTSFEHNGGAGPVVTNEAVTYTVTFSEPMSASTVEASDFGNTGLTPMTVNSVSPTANPAVFSVVVTPTAAGTLRLQVVLAATLTDLEGNALDTDPAIPDDSTLAVANDTVVPTLISIDDNVGGGPIVGGATVNYTVTFNEAMNAATVEVTDFDNAGSPAASITSVAATGNPAVFDVAVVSSVGAGSLQLRIKTGAVLTDSAGNQLDTTSALPDDTTIAVNAAPTLVCQLGILNLSANGGINPATGNPWALGDTYRLIFVTSTNTTATSTDIATYNAFVQSLADATGLGSSALGPVTWKMVGSTATDAARDNTGTNPGVNGVGEPIFRMDGTFAIANNYADLWDGINNTHVTGQDYLSVHLDENGVERTDDRVRTGSNGNGTATSTNVFGSSFVQTGRNYSPDFYGGLGGNSWMADWAEPAADAGRVYAMSGILTLQVASTTYATWATINAGGQTSGQDYDDDGVENGIEYFMGQTGSSFTAMPGLDGSNTVTWAMDPAYSGTYEVQTSPDLSTWTNVDPRPLPSGGNLSYTLPSGLGKQFVRLLVTPTP